MSFNQIHIPGLLCADVISGIINTHLPSVCGHVTTGTSTWNVAHMQTQPKPLLWASQSAWWIRRVIAGVISCVVNEEPGA